jgi:hypothetical protein
MTCQFVVEGPIRPRRRLRSLVLEFEDEDRSSKPR